MVSLSGTQVPADWAAAGKTRFDALCAACHGVDGRGNPALGAPNLFDGAWLYGSNIESVVASVRDGRNGVMPAWRQRLSVDEVRLITAWIMAQGMIEVVSERERAKERHERREPWYRPPVMWLGIAVLLASIAGCIALIFTASSG